RSSCSQVLELVRVELGNRPRNYEKQSASNFFGLPRTMFSQGFFRELVKFASSEIIFNLAIPFVRIVLPKPPTKTKQFLAIELADILFSLFDLRRSPNLQ